MMEDVVELPRPRASVSDREQRKNSPGRLAPALEFEPLLIEEAVCRALRGHPLEWRFRIERDPIYAVVDAEQRERAFQRVHLAWFQRLGLDRAVSLLLAEQREAFAQVERILVLAAASARAEGAELFVQTESRSGCPRRRLVLRLRPETLCDPQRSRWLLRHELLHIADMLDPAFGYAPRLPEDCSLPAYARLLRDRYRVLWDTTIDGRLARRGWANPEARAQRAFEFRAVFPMLGERLAEVFDAWFDGERPSHGQLVDFARAPDRAGARPAGGGRCSLCNLPSFALIEEASRLPPALLALIQTDFPDWRPSDGICGQCADLYDARCRLHNAAEVRAGCR